MVLCFTLCKAKNSEAPFGKLFKSAADVFSCFLQSKLTLNFTYKLGSIEFVELKKQLRKEVKISMMTEEDRASRKKVERPLSEQDAQL